MEGEPNVVSTPEGNLDKTGMIIIVAIMGLVVLLIVLLTVIQFPINEAPAEDPARAEREHEEKTIKLLNKWLKQSGLKYNKKKSRKE